jgi:hypothetical protein
VLAAIASGITVLFFIEAFAFDQPLTELLQRWFTGFLITFVNLTFTELFFAKWQDIHRTQDLNLKIFELEQVIGSKSNELNTIRDRLTKANSDVERLVVYVTELEEFKRKEVDKLKCPFCHTQMDSIYRLSSHKGICNHNPKRGQKESIFEAVV